MHAHRTRLLLLAVAVVAALAGEPLVPGRGTATAQALSQAQQSTEPTPTLEQLYDALRAPTIVGALPTPDTLKIGRAQIQRGPGARMYLLSAAGRPCGWLLEGPATLTYRVEDRYSVPVARRNLKAAGGLEFGTSDDVLWIKAVVQGIAAWTWDVPLAQATIVDADQVTWPPWLRDTVDRKLTTQPETDMLLAGRNGEAGVAWVIFRSADDHLILRVDPRPTERIEVLSRLRKVPSAWGWNVGNKLFDEELAVQPLERSWLDPPAIGFMSVDTELDVVNPSEGTLIVSARTRLQMLRDGVSVLPMSLATDFETRDKHPYRITKLSVDGATATWMHRSNLLFVDLPRGLRRDERVTLEVVVEGDVLTRKSDVHDHWRLLGTWYPRPQPFGQEFAEIRTAAALRVPLLPLAGGEVQERRSDDGMNHLRARLAGPMDTGVLVGGRYATTTQGEPGRRVQVHTFEDTYWTTKANATRLASTVTLVRDCLERWLGVPYPFTDLQVIETGDRLRDAPGVIFFSGNDLRDAGLYRGTGTLHWVAREVAHGWFSHVAKVTSTEDAWLAESLADYTSAYCLSQIDTKEGAKLFNVRVDEWEVASKRAGQDVSVLLAEHLPYRSDKPHVRADLLWGRGPLVLHGVRERLVGRHGNDTGTKMFLTWIRSYVKNFTYKPAHTRDLIAILEQIAGESWQAYFERYLLGTDPPPVK